MAERYTYLLVDLGCVFFPLLFSFHPKIRFYRQWPLFALPCLCVAALFIPWDIAFTHKGIWAFNARKTCGLYLSVLPLEEWLFFVCIPFASVFTWYCINRFYRLERYSALARLAALLLAIALLYTGIAHLAKLYTSVTFISLALFLLALAALRAHYLPSFFVSYLLILVPFFISNGILTGTGINSPVVTYDDRYNLGIRILTIPVEDVFYGMLLVFMNLTGFTLMQLISLKRRSYRQRPSSS